MEVLLRSVKVLNHNLKIIYFFLKKNVQNDDGSVRNGFVRCLFVNSGKRTVLSEFNRITFVLCIDQIVVGYCYLNESCAVVGLEGRFGHGIHPN